MPNRAKRPRTRAVRLVITELLCIVSLAIEQCWINFRSKASDQVFVRSAYFGHCLCGRREFDNEKRCGKERRFIICFTVFIYRRHYIVCIFPARDFVNFLVRTGQLNASDVPADALEGGGALPARIQETSAPVFQVIKFSRFYFFTM